MNTLEEVLEEVNRCGSVTLHRDGKVYTIALRPTGRPVDIEELRKNRVKMPGISMEDWMESIYQEKHAGHDT